jgi:hypothetical protein
MMDLALIGDGALSPSCGSEAALLAARALSPVLGQVLGTGTGLAIVGYPDERRRWSPQ